MPALADDVDEHPIIFNDWSIRRILAGEKTQTRRIVKPQPPKGYPNALSLPPRHCGRGTTGYLKNGEGWYWREQTAVDEAKWRPVGGSSGCPYGQAGDVLWCREAFRFPAESDNESPSAYVDRWERPSYAREVVVYEASHNKTGSLPDDGLGDWGRKRPSTHMPRELCRIRLRVEEVRVERVQEIDMDDLFAEGLNDDGAPPITMNDPENRYFAVKSQFADLWNEIHGDGAWDDNPWVWVVEFSRLDE
jgi:hypothetical protein